MCMRLILSRTDYARANTGGSNSAVLGCSLAQSQARAPVEANYARRRRLLTHFYMYVHIIFKASQSRGRASGSRAYERHEMQGVIIKSTRHECSVCEPKATPAPYP